MEDEEGSPPTLTIQLWEIPEKKGWAFRVPELSVTGGGCRTLRAALLHCLDSVKFAKDETGPSA